MTQQAVTFQQVTVSEAAGILGVSTQTIRRMIRRGQLEGERVHRPQGSAYVVRVPADGATGATDAPPTQQPASNVSRANATGPGTASELMAAWSETFLGPIMARMAEQETMIREQAETIGRLSAENEALRSSHSPVASNLAPEGPDPSPEPSTTVGAPEAPVADTTNEGPWWRRLLLAVYG